MKPVVELKNVTKVIKGKKIIDNLTFNIQEGEVFGFLGPNGAGKTTTIRMIVGLMKISSGDILVCGKNVKSEYEDALRNVGGIVENPEMYKFLTGYQNLMQYARMIKGITKEKINEVIELVGLEDRIHEKVKTYSLGMRQRLGLAQSLLHEPKVMILDEPTNGLDPAGIREIRDHLRKLTKQKGMAVIVSSHLLSEMEMMCDRIAIIQKGKLIDVQKVHDFVYEDDKQKYFIEVELTDNAKESLKTLQEYSIKQVETGIEVEIEKNQVPEFIQSLIQAGIRIYEVKPMSKSLEDRFLEITSKEEKVHA
ncbi:ABC transporter ATP-binding protein [Heyndrickxia oleronia]|jgi:ABC-2 type transport system ATP-binding protein|uniref:Bacitracin ABC transporter ATP-binding protein n=1 Tax=Heyndrickxia oleronia TaxID=38875 RepID=A0A8E2LDB7_9BACI|nr:ABC transporter ATP-binding protein [Heyndrickxia oleronia]OJH20442.1 bacitracin ABC transporter ATP-binding protein [Bacillus obstructivus]MCI1590316.1 ABC transporter ATP-binding protein [Heyndrickxia oleronia]MCI1614098.1 ABC transporter ATP-binding protein [Heyndrickxia oleronia]MCI1745252.1 ABC transporter ATP-binding protein [Heyndrickxia oleronia]MCI1762081.1 ABC transporter ATP-binding protein [Heyndrickxia oleronia]